MPCSLGSLGYQLPAVSITISSRMQIYSPYSSIPQPNTYYLTSQHISVFPSSLLFKQGRSGLSCVTQGRQEKGSLSDRETLPCLGIKGHDIPTPGTEQIRNYTTSAQKETQPSILACCGLVENTHMWKALTEVREMKATDWHWKQCNWSLWTAVKPGTIKK